MSKKDTLGKKSMK